MDFQPFNQSPPELGNQFHQDRVLRSVLARILPSELANKWRTTWETLGELAGGELYRMQLADRLNEPTLTQWSPWGERIDQIEVSPLWKRCDRLVPEYGIVAAAYDSAGGRFARVDQFARMFLFTPSTDFYGCPLAMTDGAARTLLASGHQELIDRAVPRLTSTDPGRFWTSGQWMTESTGGSDVGISETVAVPDGDAYRLHGRKWFTSATTSQMALTLARPEGNGPGGRGLALFYVETRDERGRLQNIEVNRLKDKLGTRKVPTAELMLRGARAIPVKGTENGVRNITPMLNVTRTWNAVTSVALMRRGVALARDYATKRVAFGAKLSEKPLHLDTLADVAAETEAAFHLTFHVVELLGRLERGEDRDQAELLLRVLTPIAKLTTGKQVVALTSEVLESFGGAGYVEDTGLPTLLRDAQVLPIWEGTTNVLSLDTLRAISGGDVGEALEREVSSIAAEIDDGALREAAGRALGAIRHATTWLRTSATQPAEVERGARRFAMTLGRALEGLLFARHAAWSLAHEKDERSKAAALRFLRTRLDLVEDGADDPRRVALDV